MMGARREHSATRVTTVVIGTGVVFLAVLIMAVLSPSGNVSYAPDIQPLAVGPSISAIPAHIATPDPLKGVYMTACTASLGRLRDSVLKTIEGTEVNALVVDIKDYTGTISYASTSLQVSPHGSGCRIVDLPAFVSELHAQGLYAIARITVFQDPLYASLHPESAVQSLSHPGKVWRDRKGQAYVDPGSHAYWQFIVKLAQESYGIGFDEINFDYIRFPSDGDMADASYPLTMGKQKPEAIREFFSYLRDQLGPSGVPISADLFGMTTIATNDMGIGQIIEDALPYFDYIAPMVYPSHFGPGIGGFVKPAEHPYDIVKRSMDRAVLRAVAASTTPAKLRPWLQAFDLGAVYTPAMVQLQMQATYDSGLQSWMLWNAASQYDRRALIATEAVVPASFGPASTTDMRQ